MRENGCEIHTLEETQRYVLYNAGCYQQGDNLEEHRMAPNAMVQLSPCSAKNKQQWVASNCIQLEII